MILLTKLENVGHTPDTETPTTKSFQNKNITDTKREQQTHTLRFNKPKIATNYYV